MENLLFLRSDRILHVIVCIRSVEYLNVVKTYNKFISKQSSFKRLAIDYLVN